MKIFLILVIAYTMTFTVSADDSLIQSSCSALAWRKPVAIQHFNAQCAGYELASCAKRGRGDWLCQSRNTGGGDPGAIDCKTLAWQLTVAKQKFEKQCVGAELSYCEHRSRGDYICVSEGAEANGWEREQVPNEPNNTDCPIPEAVECLVTLYSKDGYQGAKVCLTDERYYTHSELASLGIAKGATRSVKVADGYYARFNFTGKRDDGWDMVMRGNDPSLFLGEKPGGFAYKNLSIERRSTCRERPRVFMAMHGANRLAPPKLDDEWTYVRENLDGIWENNTDISLEEMAAIYRKVNTRTMILELAGANNRGVHPVERFSKMQQQNPDIVLNREAVAIYNNPASKWRANDIPRAKAEYVTNPNAPEWMKFKHVYGGFQPKQFLLPEDNPKEPTLDQTNARAVIDQIDGGFAECGSDRCRAHFQRALYSFIEQLREGDRPFIWFTGTFDDPEDWFKGMKQTYFRLEADDMLRPDDIVMLINYEGGFDSTPETSKKYPDGAPTATGMLYWLLHQ